MDQLSQFLFAAVQRRDNRSSTGKCFLHNRGMDKVFFGEWAFGYCYVLNSFFWSNSDAICERNRKGTPSDVWSALADCFLLEI